MFGIYSKFTDSEINHFNLKKSETSFRCSTEHTSLISSLFTCISSTLVSNTSSSIFDKSTLDFEKVTTHFFGNIQATLPGSHIFQPNFENICLIFAAVLFLLSVKTCITIATQPGAYHS